MSRMSEETIPSYMREALVGARERGLTPYGIEKYLVDKGLKTNRSEITAHIGRMQVEGKISVEYREGSPTFPYIVLKK